MLFCNTAADIWVVIIAGFPLQMPAKLERYFQNMDLENNCVSTERC